MTRKGLLFVGFIALLLVAFTGQAQSQTKRRHRKPKKSIQMLTPSASAFHPTFTMAPGTVGSFFYPHTIGSSWEMKIVQKYFRPDNAIIESDSLYSVETVTSDTGRAIQGVPLIICGSRTWRGTDSTSAERAVDVYYVDDSLIMAVFNSSLWSNQNRVLLVSPLRVGAHWLEQTGDSARTEIVSMHDTVSVPFGNFGNAIVAVTRYGQLELDKYFVPNVGLVKTIMRRPGNRPGEAVVVTSELVKLHKAPEHSDATHGGAEQGGLQELVPGTVPGSTH